MRPGRWRWQRMGRGCLLRLTSVLLPTSTLRTGPLNHLRAWRCVGEGAAGNAALGECRSRQAAPAMQRLPAMLRHLSGSISMLHAYRDIRRSLTGTAPPSVGLHPDSLKAPPPPPPPTPHTPR